MHSDHIGDGDWLVDSYQDATQSMKSWWLPLSSDKKWEFYTCVQNTIGGVELIILTAFDSKHAKMF